MKQLNRKRLTARLDKLFSLRIRLRGHCERCLKSDNLQCAHVITRTNRQVRWDEDNAMCLCAGCHLWWHKEPFEAVKWFQGKWPERYEKVRLKANNIGKVDLELLLEELNI